MALEEAGLTRLVELDEKLIRLLGEKYSHEQWGVKEFLLELPGKPQLSCAAVGCRVYRGVVGFCIASLPRPGWAHVHRLGVAPEMWRQGVGRDMVGWSMARAMERGARAVSVSVARANSQGRHFYQALGFLPLKGWELQRWAIEHGRKGQVKEWGISEGRFEYVIMIKRLK